MKAISIQQPWGTLVCGGVKDVENRSWPLRQAPCRVLIHAGAKRQPMLEGDMPLVWRLLIENAQRQGVIGPLSQLPTSALLGVATMERCDRESDSPWACVGPGAEWKWKVSGARLFKAPILGVKGRLGLFDAPEVREDELPELQEPPILRRSGEELEMSLAPELFAEASRGRLSAVSMNLTDENMSVFADEKFSPLPTSRLLLRCGGRGLAVRVSGAEVFPVADRNGNPIVYEDFSGCEYEWWVARLSLR